MIMRRILLFAVIFTWVVAGADVASAQGRCLRGVSKNFCTATLKDGQWPPKPCAGTHCSIWDGVNSVLTIPLTSGGAPCDEAANLASTVKVSPLQGRIRRNPALRSEGFLEGTFILLSGNNQVGSGSFNSTVGVGTHRVVQCHGATCGKECEKCYDVQQVGTSWRIGTEGFFQGEVSAGPFKGCLIRWSFQGTYTAPAQPGTAEPMPPGSGWNLCGTIDGVLDCPCG